MKITTRTTLVITFPLLLTCSMLVTYWMTTENSLPEAVIITARGSAEATKAPSRTGAATPTDTPTAAQAASVPSQVQTSAPALPSTEQQPEHLPDVTVKNTSLTAPEVPPIGTPRTPLEWKPLKTKSGKTLMGATLDNTWAVPLNVPPAGETK
jgi:hypothetical protein